MSSTARKPWLMLSFVTAAFVLNHMDRQVINILSQPIKAELHISDTALSFLAGTAFTLVYAFAAVPIARLADRFDRVNVISLSVGFWSFMTALCGFAQGYGPLLLFRVGVGFGEAGGIPASHSLISDHFSQSRRAMAMGIYALGIPVGTLLGLLMGGIINDWVGWRGAFFVAAAPGLLLAVLIRTFLRETPRGQSEVISPVQVRAGLGETWAALARNRAYWVITLGCGSALLLVYVSNAWFPPLLFRLHGMPIHDAGIALGLFAGIGGGLGTLVSGPITDALNRRIRNAELWVAVVGLVLTFPLYVTAVWVRDTPIALAAMAGQFTLMYVWVAPSYAITQRVVPVHMRALASSIQIGAGALIAQILGPQLVGLLSDHFSKTYGADGLRYALISISLVSLVGAGLFAWPAVILARGQTQSTPEPGPLNAFAE